MAQNRTIWNSRFTPIALLMVVPAALYFPLGCAVGVSGAVNSPAAKAQQAASTGVVAPAFFGMVVKSPALQPTVATGARRLWDSGVTWAALEPVKGRFVWTTLDAEVAAAGQAGAQVTLTLGLSPTWASSQPSLPSVYGAGATAMPANLGDWDTYVAAVASRYAGRIGAYEVWNAPEDPASWSGAASGTASGTASQVGINLAVLAQHTAAAVRAADGAALVVSPALSPAGLAQFLAAGGGESVDVVASALDGAGEAPEAMADNVHALRAAMAGTAVDGKPLWNNQASWQLPAGGLSQDLQAAYVARALVLNAGFGVQRMHWYAWDENSTGAVALTDAQTRPTAAGLAYATVESWLRGAAMNGCAATASGVWTCQLVRGDAATEWIVWSSTGEASSSSLGAATVTDLQGNVTAVVNGSIQAGASPVLLQ